MSGGMLEGIRIIDLTSVVVGPLATQILADHGADVIKVESPAGDIGRSLSGKGRSPGMAPKYLHLNRNKRSICLDLKHAEGLAALRRLIEGADVLLWNVRPSSMERLGLSYEQVSAIKPDIIYCGMFGFGQTGCYRAMAAYDSIIQGVSGVADLNARVTGTPQYVPYVLADRNAGLIAVQLIAMALFHRERTGEGQSIEVPMYENMVTQVMTEHMYQQTFVPPLGEAGDPRVLDKENRPIPTRDGYICISANTDAQAFALFDAIGRPELKSDGRFNTVSARFQNVQAYFSLRRQALASRTTGEWMTIFQQADVPAAPYNSLESLLDDPHLREVGLFAKRQHPSEGEILEIQPANKVSVGMRNDWMPAPRLGEHTTQVLQEAGLYEADISRLLAAGGARQG
ncbi:CaiB/BaiF CoA transferase family protein [Bordetella genomosp. 12]|uniref:Formyl-CoA transferase n=1 Tax=Bordetella genomosp. 12 TaxID=463035 RepID=A0A261VDC8_9BORD|nr:CoA transferase [Bordetella genomosp. 12]OZI71562.1 formyl-CoA transferase [Bordetella genomosp. 12]